MARNRTRGRFVRPPARTSIWINVGLGEIAVGAGTVNLLGTGNAALLASRPFTIVRTRITLLYTSDQVAAAETPFGSFGLIVVSDKAAALGVTAVPMPDTQSDGDFFVWQGCAHNVFSQSAVGIGELGVQYEIDSKAMRKVGPDEDIGMCFEQVATVGAITVTQGRMLIKLH